MPIYRISFLFPVVLFALSTLATAQQIDEIIVYGDLRESEIEDVPTSVTVLDEALIRQRNASHFEEMVAAAANLNLSNGASRARFFQIRGVGERGQFTEPLNPSVGLLIDGVDFSGIGGISTLFDVEQIEVFRGPQGDLYGANALAGLISLRSHAAEHEPSGRLRLEAGDYGVRGLGAAYGGSLSDTVAFRTSLSSHAGDGYIHNIHLDTRDTNDLDELTWRGKLSIDVSDNASLDVNLGLVDLNNGYDAFSLDNDRRTRSDQPGADRQESVFGSLRLEVASELFDTELSVASAKTDIEYGYDEDWTYDGFHPWGYSSTDQYNRDRDTLTAEVRLTSSEAGSLFDGRGAWVAGLYMLRQQVDLLRVYTYADSDFGSRFEIQRLAAYGRIESDLSDRGRLTVGLRLEAHESDYSDTADLAYNPDENLVGGRICLRPRPLGQLVRLREPVARLQGGRLQPRRLAGHQPAPIRCRVPLQLRTRLQGPVAGCGAAHAPRTVPHGPGRRADRQLDHPAPGRRQQRVHRLHRQRRRRREPGRGGGTRLESWRADPDHGQPRPAQQRIRELHQRQWRGPGRTRAGPCARVSIPPCGQSLTAREPGALPVARRPRRVLFLGQSRRHVPGIRPVPRLAHLGVPKQRDFSFSLWGRNLTDEDYFVRGFFFGNDPRDGYVGHRYTQLGEPRRFGLTVSREF